jgi:hypothetical protein
MTQMLYRMGGKAHIAPVEAPRLDERRARPSGTDDADDALRLITRLESSPSYRTVHVTSDEAASATAWAKMCARELGISAPQVWFFDAATRVHGYVKSSLPGGVFIRADMGLAETRSTIAHECAHVAGADEREARRYEADRRRGAWWAPAPPKRAAPTADDWAMHAARLRARRAG